MTTTTKYSNHHLAYEKHKPGTTEYHLKKMNHHHNEYNKALRTGSKFLAQDHAKAYHAEKDALERLSRKGEVNKD